MRPFLLKGHERPLTQVKYNNEGDLFVSCAKNLQPCLWWGEDGQRIGTYEGHNGAVWSCEFTLDSEKLFTASADQTVRIWQTNGGKELFQFKLGEPCRAVSLSAGETHLVFTTDAFMGTAPTIHIVPLAEDMRDQTSRPQLTIITPKGRITRAYWSDCNRSLITSHDHGFLRRWDVETGKMTQEKAVHEDAIQDMQVGADGVQAITASLDKSAALIDLETFEVLKSYKTGRFVNSAALSPIYDHVLLGGGQDASSVTTTAAKAGGFEARFFHKVFQEEFGQVRGHFGPINTVAFSPTGRSFLTGGEDGYVRLHHLDYDYFQTKYF